jgi:hypothetical protein
MRRCLDEEQRERSELTAQTVRSAGVDTATKRVNRGYASFLTTGLSARPNSALFSPGPSGTISETVTIDPSSPEVKITADLQVHGQILLPSDALNDATVELEHQRFLEEPVIPANDMENTSPIDYWLVHTLHNSAYAKITI